MTRRFSPFFFLCVMGGLAIFSTTMSKNPALPLFISSLGVDEGTLGLIAAASTVVGVVVSLPAGILSDLWGRRNVILLSMVVFATAPFLYLLVTTPGQLVLVRIYHGLATAILGPVAMAAVADTFQAGRGERMAWYSSATMVGRFVAPSVGGLLIMGNDFHWVYLGCGVAGVLALVASLRWQSSLQPVAPGNRRQSARWAQAGPPCAASWAWCCATRIFCSPASWKRLQYFAFGAVETFLPLYLKGIGYSAWEIGLSSPRRSGDRRNQAGPGPAIGSAGAATLHCRGVDLRRGSRRRHALHHQLLGADGPDWRVRSGVAAVTASTSALVSDSAGQSSYGSALGVLSSIMDVGHSSGPAVVGFLVVYWHYGPAFALVAGVLVVGAVLFYALLQPTPLAHRLRHLENPWGRPWMR